MTKTSKMLLGAAVPCALTSGLLYSQVNDLQAAYQAKAEAAHLEWESGSPARTELSRFLARCDSGDMKVDGKPPVLLEDCYRIFERQTGRSIRADLQELRTAEGKAFTEAMTTAPQPLKLLIEVIEGES